MEMKEQNILTEDILLEKKKKRKKESKDIFKSMAITFIVTMLFLIFIAQFVRVDGTSMYPTYNDNQIVFIEKITKDYERNDIVVFKGSDRLIIKRIIGLPGETVQIKNNNIYINDKKINDEHFVGEMEYYGRATNKITLAEDEYFVMGDNRNNSLDSRYNEIGNINSNQIIGKVVGT